MDVNCSGCPWEKMNGVDSMAQSGGVNAVDSCVLEVNGREGLTAEVGQAGDDANAIPNVHQP